MRKPWDLPPGSQGCSGTGRGRERRRSRRRVDGGRLLLSCVTLLNVALTLALAVYNRGEVLHAVRTKEGEGAQVLLTRKKETKT